MFGTTKRPWAILRTTGVLAVSFLALFLALKWVEGLSTGDYEVVASLRNISTALRYLDETEGHFPNPVTTDRRTGARCSWRVNVYEAIASHGLIDAIQYDRSKEWNAPVNLCVQSFGNRLFRYVPDQRQADKSTDDGFSTFFKAITGAGTAFSSAETLRLDDLPHDTILIVRVEESNTHWMEPQDLAIEDLISLGDSKRILLGDSGYAVLFADGEAWSLSRQLPIADLARFFTVEGARNSDRAVILGPFRLR